MLESIELYVCTVVVGAIYLIILGIFNLKKKETNRDCSYGCPD